MLAIKVENRFGEPGLGLEDEAVEAGPGDNRRSTWGARNFFL